MNLRRLLVAALLSVCALTVTGCSTSASDTDRDQQPAPSTPAETSESPTAGSGAGGQPTEAPTTPAEDSAQHPSLTDYFDELPDASPIQLGRVREQTAAYTSYDVSYRSDGLRITGVLNVPTGSGPFPAVVLAHGWIDRGAYVTGQGMTRERGHLSENGYVALHVDYRAHAGSDDDPELLGQLYRGYAVDVLGGVSALRASDLPVDDEQIGLMGRSMGGSVVLQALEMAPGLVDAGIVYSAQSSLESDNYRQWGERPVDGYGAEYASRHGTPDENPAAWQDMSTRPYVDRITEPVLMIHGTRDEQCPPEWARATHTALAQADVDVQLNWYDDYHAFGPRFTQSMEDTVAFLQRHLT